MDLPYILHAAVFTLAFYTCFQLLWAKETFFALNRWLILTSILLSFVLPTLKIPATWSVWQENPKEEIPIEKVTTPNETIPAPNPIDQSQVNHDQTKAKPSEVESDPLTTNVAHSIPNRLKVDWPTVLWYLYLAGVCLFTINLFIQLGTLFYQIIRLPSIKDGGIRIVELNNDQPPYSFLNVIFINPTKYDWETYNQILDHERIHIQQGHTLDMVLMELLVIFQWFNPAAWKLRKLTENNLEFLTDQSMLDQGVKRAHYQLNLLKVSVPQHPIGLAMNYNQSTLKKRISMMNAKKSSVQSSWKYLLLLPVLGLSISTFNRVVAQHPIAPNALQDVTPITGSPQVVETPVAIEVQQAPNPPREIATPPPLPSQTTMPTNSAPEVDPVPTVDPEKAATSILNAGPIKGFWQAEVDAQAVCVQFENSRDNWRKHWNISRCFAPEIISPQPTTGDGTYVIKREAGKVTLVGNFKNDYGQGRFTFEPAVDFVQYLNQKGYRNLEDEYVFHLYMADINRAYFDYLAKEGLTEISKQELLNLAIHGLTLDYLKENLSVFRNKGFKNVTPEKLIQLKIHHVSKEYIEAMASIGFPDLSIQDLMKGSIHGVDPDYVKEIRALGFEDLTFDDYVDFHIHGVDQDLVESLAGAGFENLSARKIKEASIHGINVDYIDELKQAGYDLKNIDEVIKFKIHGVDTEFVNQMIQMGYADLSEHEITSAAIHGVDVGDVKALEKAGYKDLSVEEVIQLSIHNVDMDYVNELRKLGYDDLSLEEVIQAKIHGLSIKFAESLSKAGYNDLPLEELLQAKIHGLSPSYVESFAKAGYTDIPLDEMVQAKIHGISPSFIQGFSDLGFTNIPLDELVGLKIHGVTPSFIKRAQAKGMKDLSLEEYKKLKIHGLVKD